LAAAAPVHERCAKDISSGNETITYTATENGTLFVSVHGYAAGGFTVKMADQ
jgi:hypothetical protein